MGRRMASLNRVFLAGNLTRDPEIRYISSGKAKAELGMAINRKYKTASGEDKEETCFVNVTAWGRQAELAGEYLKKGASVLVEGTLRFEQWESNGEKRSRHSVTADRIQFLDRAGGGGGGGARRREAAPEPADEAPRAESPDAEPSAEAGAPDGKTDADNLPF
jgi:single-strand DNA-binding protein